MGEAVFKIKHNGQKIKVRVLGKDEPINERCLQRSSSPEALAKLSPEGIQNELSRGGWVESRCVGETPSEHPERIYIEVLSAFYKGGSVGA